MDPLHNQKITNGWRNHGRGSLSQFRGGKYPREDNLRTAPKGPRRGLQFNTLLKLSKETTTPIEVVEKIGASGGRLKELIEDNQTNLDVLELVLVMIGHFCKNNGRTLFSSAFANMVQILGEGNMFAQIFHIVMQIPRSRSKNLPSAEDRINALLTSVNHLTLDILIMMPAFACNALGEDFFLTMKSLKDVHPLNNMNLDFSFQSFDEGNRRLKNAWEQQTKANGNGHVDQARLNRAALDEMRGMQKPPDDFRELSVAPKWEDVCTDEEAFIRPNIIKGRFPDVDTYLDIQFRLLREDLYSPLRDGLSGFKHYLALPANKNKLPTRIENVRFYHQVQISDFDGKEKNGEMNQYLLKFSIKGLERINWETSKRLLHGSLLCLSSDNFSSFHLFTVSQRFADQLSRGRVVATLEDSEKLSVKLQREVYTMAESPVYFEAYRSFLSALQSISPFHFPMKKYILGHSLDVKPPRYLRDKIVRYNFSAVLSPSIEDDEEECTHWNRNSLSSVNLFDLHTRPKSKDLGLDPSQTEALYAALTQKLAVIQGPPGTGKTFLGLKVVELLLKNKTFWSQSPRSELSPILVICYTNHALDQFLEGILKFTQNIVRVGGRSNCESLKAFSLREWNIKHRGGNRRLYYEARNEFFNSQNLLRARKEVMKYAQSFGIVHEYSLHDYQIISKTKLFEFQALKRIQSKFASKNQSILPYWLGIENEGENQKLVSVLRGLKGKIATAQTTLREYGNTTTKEASQSIDDEDDQWDKEDIDEILDKRLIDQDQDVYADDPNESNNNHQPILPQSNILFGLKFSQLQNQINDYEARKTVEEDDNLLKMDEEEKKQLNHKIDAIRQQLKYLGDLLKTVPLMNEKEKKFWFSQPLLSVPHQERWKMYISWITDLVEQLDVETTELAGKCNENWNYLKEIEILRSVDACHTAEIVGITTTGAAKQRVLLEHLKPKIIIVEEAAEVLEAHITTSLSTTCQHLILIGDHKQLRPPTSVHRLAKDFHLDVSLFERLINNGVKSSVLSLQHRMRPEVARLIVPTIYPTLENDRSVLEYPDVRGMKKNVFFLSHNERERQDQEAKSHLNPYEVDMALALVRHLLMQGYDPSQITVLTTYSGQLLHFKKVRRNQALLNGVRISIVDNFQGEENDIIILSLVRSNQEESIGFLRIENRICVALSRAKMGFYLIGNMKVLEGKSKVWNQISRILDHDDQIGSSFELKCEVHNTIRKANTPLSFPPEGGCSVKCSTSMPCGHICLQICHAYDREHLKQRCNEDCQRSCPVGHPCPKRCSDDCHPCETRVVKNLPCLHTKNMQCWKDPKDEYCDTKVWKVFPICKHEIEMECSAQIKKVKCTQTCGMILNCSHECNLTCHERSSHDKIPCRQKCLRTPCPEGHPCPKECFEPCGDCIAKVVKKLPCGHEAEVECHILPMDVYCEKKVVKSLTNCQHTAAMACSKPVTDYVCRQICGKPLCVNGHTCREVCSKPCDPCKTNVKRQLGCGHTLSMRCHQDPSTFKCPNPKLVTLPHCNHNVVIKCGANPEDIACPMQCDIRLECGHVCAQKCHKKSDPDHHNYLCKKRCERVKRGCKNNHKCGKLCHEECDTCMMQETRILPCGHKAFTSCSVNDEDIFCSKTVVKTIPGCGHTLQDHCSKVLTREDCKEMCEKILICKHRCAKLCKDDCDVDECQEKVTVAEPGFCKHDMVLPCREYRSVGKPYSNSLKEKSLAICNNPCRSHLKPCEHECAGTCGECFNGRLHRACQQECKRPLVCGHLCDVNCSAVCPPCKKKCEYRCQHSRCDKICSEPCSPCMESCGWQCQHYRCSRKCWEICNRPPCDQPCKKRLECGHPCVGLCGEECPPLCRVCHKSELTEIFLGNEEDADARFVYLPDCGHCIEVEGLDQWMGMTADEGKGIQMKCCPRCKTIIRYCSRYGNIIKNNMHDVVRVKEKLLGPGHAHVIFAAKLDERIQKANLLNSNYPTSVSPFIAKILKQINFCLFSKGNSRIIKSIDPDQKYLIEVQLDTVERILETIEKSKKVGRLGVPMKPNLFQDVLSKALRILDSVFQRQTISENMYQDLIAEIERLSLVRSFYLLQNSPSFSANPLIAYEKKVIEQSLLYGVQKLNESTKNTVKEALRQIGAKLRTGLGITDEERQQIVKAMGMRQGHWFKCPNGHIYAIGECGGAMVESKCNECGASIGGRHHSLRGDNSLSWEMDGSRFAAWSQQANEMRNFQFED